MKNYAKVGGKPGKPGYRTPSAYKIRKSRWTAHQKIKDEIFRRKSFGRG